MSLTNKTLASTYKDILNIDNSNNGFDSNLDQIRSGNGNGSSLYLSNSNVKVQPDSDSTTTKVIYDKDGNALFTVDSTNDMVKAGINQIHVNTQYAYFGVDSGDFSVLGGSDHTPIPFGVGGIQTLLSLGTGVNPDTSVTIDVRGNGLANAVWYIPDEIVIDAVHVWVGADDLIGDTQRFHLMSYDIDSSNTSTGGDLSNGVVLADGSDITNDGYEQTYYQSMTIQSSSVTAGKVVLFAYQGDSGNSDYTIKVTVKYHLK